MAPDAQRQLDRLFGPYQPAPVLQGAELYDADIPPLTLNGTPAPSPVIKKEELTLLGLVKRGRGRPRKDPRDKAVRPTARDDPNVRDFLHRCATESGWHVANTHRMAVIDQRFIEATTPERRLRQTTEALKNLALKEMPAPDNPDFARQTPGAYPLGSEKAIEVMKIEYVRLLHIWLSHFMTSVYNDTPIDKNTLPWYLLPMDGVPTLYELKMAVPSGRYRNPQIPCIIIDANVPPQGSID
jgi:hypothetical protein